MNIDRESLSREIRIMMNKRENDIIKAMADMEANCLKLAKDDLDRYVTCMEKGYKTTEKEEKKFELSLGFLHGKTEECFKKNYGNVDGINKCKENARSQIDASINDYIKNLKQNCF